MNSKGSSHSEPLRVRCLALAHGGAMVCEIIAGDPAQIGKKAFVPGLIPGEVAEIDVSEDKGAFVTGRVREILERSGERTTPPCPAFGQCGGCDLQYLPIERQRQLKREMFESTLQRQAKLKLDNPVAIYGADLPAYGYRRRITLHLNKSGELGFYRESSGDVISFDKCLIASAAINSLLAKIYPLAKTICAEVSGITLEEFNTHAVPVFHLRERVTDSALAALVSRLQKEFKLAKIYYRGKLQCEWHDNLCAEEALEFSTLSHFSQINEIGNGVLLDRVSAALCNEKEVTEFYAGAGNFTLPLARVGKLIDAVEVDERLTERGAAIARRENLKNVSFVTASVERFIEHSWHTVRSAVLLDPPRSGARALCEELNAGQVSKIVYVSCALPTLARDLAILVKNGFSISSVGIIDMFSQTHHVESLTVLETPRLR